MNWRSVVVTMGVLASAAMVSTSAAAVTDSDQSASELAAYVPAGHRYACDIADVSSPDDVGRLLSAAAASIDAMLECGNSTQDVSYIAYVKFNDLDAMNAVYEQFVGDAADQEPRSGDGECPGERTWSFDDTTVGSVGCFYATEDGTGNPIPERAVLAWTYDDALILGLANSPAADADTLSTWWDDEAGPLRRPATVDALVATPGVSSHSAERRLRSHVPKAFRSSCQNLDVGDPTSVDPSYYRSRLWVDAAIVCRPRAGVDSIYYYSIDPTAIDGFFTRFTAATDDDSDTCPTEGTWTVGKGSKRHEVGEYVCFVDSQLQAARIQWSQRDLGIMSSAIAGDTDLDALYDFWSTRAGPT